MKAFIDFIPLILFFYLYKTVDPNDSAHFLLAPFGIVGDGNNHILAATVALSGSIIIIYTILFFVQKYHLNKQQWLMLVMTVVFGGLTLLFSDDYYIRLKAIVINTIFGIALLLSPYVLKAPLIKKLFDPVFFLTPRGWFRLNMAWSGMFFGMAALHAFFAFIFFGGQYWGEFTAFGDILVMLAFMLVMLYCLRKNIRRENFSK